MAKAQAGLEYLIIIAAVIGIAAVVVYTISGVMSTQSSSASIAACKQSSVDCKASRMLAPGDPCSSCYRGCTNPATGKDVIQGAVYCCNHSETNKIYADSTECSTLVTITSPSGLYTGASATLSATTPAAAACTYKSSTGTYQPMSTTGGTSHSQALSGLTEGPVTYYVRCTDAQGKYGEASKSWTVDVTPPTVTLSSPTSGTVSGTITLSASGIDALSGIGSVFFYINSRPRYSTSWGFCALFTGCSGSPCTQTLDTTHYGNGPLTVYAQGYDRAGNMVYSTTTTVTVSNTCAGTCCGMSAVPSCTSPYVCRICSDGYNFCGL